MDFITHFTRWKKSTIVLSRVVPWRLTSIHYYRSRVPVKGSWGRSWRFLRCQRRPRRNRFHASAPCFQTVAKKKSLSSRYAQHLIICHCTASSPNIVASVKAQVGVFHPICFTSDTATWCGCEAKRNVHMYAPRPTHLVTLRKQSDAPQPLDMTLTRRSLPSAFL